MNKKQFESFLNKHLQELSTKNQRDLIKKIQNVWLPEILEKKLKNYTFCCGCKEYSLTKKFKTNHKKEIRSTQTFRDSGYGDDDRYGDVEYMITYSTCPICGKVEEIKKVYLRTICEQDRYGNIYK